MNDLDYHIRALRPTDIDPTERERRLARERLDFSIDEAGGAVERRRHSNSRRRMGRAALLAAAMVLMIGAIAGGAELFKPDPISTQLPGAPGVGWSELSDTVDYRISLSIDPDDQSFCAKFESKTEGVGSGGMCGGALPESGVNLRWTCGSIGIDDPVTFVMNGIVAGDVEHIAARTFGGDSRELAISHNTVSDVVNNPLDAPETIIVERAGATHSIDSPPLGCD